MRDAYERFDYKRVVARLSAFLNTDLSAFYFDIRKDALYCEPLSSEKRRASLEVIEQIFRAVTLWLAPILVFTGEECWLSRYGDAISVHLETFPAIPAAWRDDALAEKWEQIRRIRSVVTGALEIERAQKRIGSSLEAAPVVYIADDASGLCSIGGFRRNLHHLRSQDRSRGGPGGGFPSSRGARRCRGLGAGRRPQMRAVMEDFVAGRQRSRISRRDAA